MIVNLFQYIPRDSSTYNSKFVICTLNENSSITRKRLRSDGTINSGNWNNVSDYVRNSSPRIRETFKLEFVYE